MTTQTTEQVLEYIARQYFAEPELQEKAIHAIEDALAAIEADRAIANKRVTELEAARIAYASEFPLNSDGEPDVGNIHANIRAMKARITQLEADRNKRAEPVFNEQWECGQIDAFNKWILTARKSINAFSAMAGWMACARASLASAQQVAPKEWISTDEEKPAEAELPPLPEPVHRKLHEMEKVAEMRGYVGFIQQVAELRLLLITIAAPPQKAPTIETKGIPDTVLEALTCAEKTINILWVSHHANRADDALEKIHAALAYASQPKQKG